MKKLTTASEGWRVQGGRLEVHVELSMDRWHSRLPIWEAVNPDWTAVMDSHEAVQKMQTCHNPRAGIPEMASPLEVEGSWKAGGYQTNHTHHLRGEERERA